jgi:hypothetical protein
VGLLDFFRRRAASDASVASETQLDAGRPESAETPPEALPGQNAEGPPVGASDPAFLPGEDADESLDERK